MEFPVDLTFKRLSWRVSLVISDASGKVIGHAPVLGSKAQRFAIHADRTHDEVRYWIAAEHPFTQWFETARGEKLGQFGLDPNGNGKFIFVAQEPRFRFVDGTPWRTWLEREFPDWPILNAIPGALLNPEVLAVRCDSGEVVFKIVKKRLMFDNRYRLTALATLTDPELECLMLSAIVYSMLDLALFQQSRP